MNSEGVTNWVLQLEQSVNKPCMKLMKLSVFGPGEWAYMDGRHANGLFRLYSGCGLTSCVPSLCMLCIYCSFSTACPFNRLWGSKGRGSDSAPELYRIVSDQDAVLPLARVKGYVWH